VKKIDVGNGKNYVVLGKSFELLKMIEDECVDMCYMDPPFDLTQNYIDVNPETHTINFYEGEWKGGINSWIIEMKKVMIEIKRVLKPEGSIFVHCDDQVAGYLKIYVLDRLFKPNNYINSITWLRSPNTGSWKTSDKAFARNGDTIFWYCKDKDKFKPNKLFVPWPKEEIKKRFPRDDNDGKGPYHWNTLTHLNQLEEKMAKGEIEASRPGSKHPWRYKVYKSENKGLALHNVWTDIKPIHGRCVEKMYYPTQKPEELLKRIIEAGSVEGDVILDPYVGSGTTAVVSRKLSRSYVVSDKNPGGIVCTLRRLEDLRQLTIPGNPNYELIKTTYSYLDLKKMDGYDFQELVFKELGGRCNNKGADGAIDGWARFPDFNPDDETVVEVKNMQASRPHLQKLLGLLTTYGSKYGVIIAHSFARTLQSIIDKAEIENGYKIKLILVEDIMKITYPLEGDIIVDEEFTATARITTKNEKLIDETFKVRIVNYLWQLVNNGKVVDIKLIEKEGVCKFKKYENLIKKGAVIRCIASDAAGESTAFEYRYQRRSHV